MDERSADIIAVWNPSMLEQLLGSLMHHDWKVTTRLDSLTSFVLTGILLVSSYTDCEMVLALFLAM